MVLVYVNLCEKGLRQPEKVPSLWKDEVIEKLKERGNYEGELPA